MRGLSPTLEAELQKQGKDGGFEHLVKIHLTDGVDIYSYTKELILDIKDPEEPWSQTAEVVLDNGDGAFTDLDLKGFYGFISKGAVTPAGEEYDDGPLLWVIAQRFNSSEQGDHQLTCELSLIGIPNWLALDKASRNYIPDEDDTKTIKTLLTEIMGGTLGCFSHCKAWEVVFDDEVAGKAWWALSLINTYKPKDSLRIYKGNSRSAIAKKLLDVTDDVMLVKADGKLHIFRPQITGTPVYTYSLESGHTFFSKAYRSSLVIPNYIYASSPPHTVPNWVIVQSDPYEGEAKDQTDIDKFGERKHTADYGAGTFGSDAECVVQAQSDLDGYIALHDPYYEGIATDPVSIAALATNGFNGQIKEFWQAAFENDAQAEDVAEARLAKHTLNAEMGAASVPMNVGAEVYDYIKVTDEREDKERKGTIGSLNRHYNWEEPEWRLSFSLGQQPKAVDVVSALEEDAPYFGRLIVDDLYAKNILAENIDFVWIDPAGNVDLSKIGDTLDNLPDGEVYARVKTLHLDAGQIKLDENVYYKAGYDPNTKRRVFYATPTTPYDLGDMWFDATVAKKCTTARASGAYVAGDWTQVSIDELGDGIVYQRVKSASLTADGLVVLDEVYIDSGAGQYDLVLRADISAGHIKLESVEQTSDFRTVADSEKTTWHGKEIAIHRGATAPSDTTKLWVDISVTPNVWKRWTGTAWVKATPTELDEIADGATYSRVFTTDISAGHIKLESVIDGGGYKKYTDTEYTKLLGIATGADVTDGHSLSVLTNRTLGFIADVATRKAVNANEKAGAGEAYDKLISKLTAYGLSIWTANSSTRVELTAAGLKGYSAGALQVEIKASDGKIYAGAGAVVIDVNGIRFNGEMAVFGDENQVIRGVIFGSTGGQLIISANGDLALIPTGGDVNVAGHVHATELHASSAMYIPAEA